MQSEDMECHLRPGSAVLGQGVQFEDRECSVRTGMQFEDMVQSEDK